MYALAGLMVVASLAHASVRFPYVPIADRKNNSNSVIVDVEGKDKTV